MKILLSPAKSLDLESKYPSENSSKLLFEEESNTLNNRLTELNRSEIKDLMSISAKLANLNMNRYEAKKSKDHSDDRPAIFMFNGDVYDGFDVATLSKEHFETLQNSVRILSGMYGILRPFDVMSPYRLEMGTKLNINDSSNLYEFWKEKLTNQLNLELNKNEFIVNLASQEYFKVINTSAIKSEIISPVFKDFKNGKYKVISFYAKKARGLMARYLVSEEIKSKAELLNFNLDGYTYNAAETKSEFAPVFTRE